MIEPTRKAQLAAEQQLEQMLLLKAKVQQQDGFALRMYMCTRPSSAPPHHHARARSRTRSRTRRAARRSHESIMMAPKQDALTELISHRATGPGPLHRLAGPVPALVASHPGHAGGGNADAAAGAASAAGAGAHGGEGRQMGDASGALSGGVTSSL